MKEKISNIGAIGTAVLSSSCCILPLAAATFGFGIGGTALFFDNIRPYLLAVTFLLLGISYYLAYFKKRNADCDSGACSINRGSSRKTKTVLWVITLLVVLIALLPYYTSLLL